MNRITAGVVALVMSFSAIADDDPAFYTTYAHGTGLVPSTGEYVGQSFFDDSGWSGKTHATDMVNYWYEVASSSENYRLDAYGANTAKIIVWPMIQQQINNFGYGLAWTATNQYFLDAFHCSKIGELDCKNPPYDVQGEWQVNYDSEFGTPWPTWQPTDQAARELAQTDVLFMTALPNPNTYSCDAGFENCVVACDSISDLISHQGGGYFGGFCGVMGNSILSSGVGVDNYLGVARAFRIGNTLTAGTTLRDHSSPHSRNTIFVEFESGKTYSNSEATARFAGWIARKTAAGEAPTNGPALKQWIMGQAQRIDIQMDDYDRDGSTATFRGKGYYIKVDDR